MMMELVVALTGSAQRISTDGSPLHQVWMQPRVTNSNPIYVGRSSAVSATNYGVRLPAPDSTPNPPPPWGPENFPVGRVSLSDFWVIGTGGEFLHIFYLHHTRFSS